MNRKQRRIEARQPRPMTPAVSPDLQRWVAEALLHHQAGRLHEAEPLYRRVLAIDPRHAESLHLLGMVAWQRGQLDSAIALIGAAISIDDTVAAYHSNLGNALLAREQPRDAADRYRRAISLEPDFAAAHFNLGNVLNAQGEAEEAAACFRATIALQPGFAEAHNSLGVAQRKLPESNERIACFRRAIELKPDFPEAHVNLGTELRDLGRLDEAAACFRRALAIRPDLPEAHFNLADILSQQGRFDAAAVGYRDAIRLRPDFPEAHVNLGIVLRELGAPEQAVVCYRTALALRPDFAAASYNLGTALRELGQPETAIACLRRAIALQPDYADAHTNLAKVLGEQGLLDEAFACYRTALDLTPGVADAHNNLGTALYERRRFDEAIGCYRTALSLRPDFADGHYNLALALLAKGEMAEGWREHEWRWRTPQMLPANREFPDARPWRGEAAAGDTLLIHAEQGYGDTLQFCRYAPLAVAKGLRVILEVPEALVRLSRSLPGVDQVVACGDALPAFAWHCPMLSLPLAFGTTVATIPSATAYLRADTELVAIWRTRLAATADQAPRIGVAWAGNPRNHSPAQSAADRRRSLAPERLAPLFEVLGLRFFSLQKDGARAPACLPLVDHMDAMRDFADTAALIANLDLVISVDTALAHLAAALGKPVWVLDRFDSCWRWLGRDDSPWYPTLRLFRQKSPGDWDAVLAEVARELRGFARFDPAMPGHGWP